MNFRSRFATAVQETTHLRPLQWISLLVISPTRIQARIYFNKKHKWYYWHGLQVDEVIAFIQADSEAENRAGMMDFTPIF